jgi:hypothetical protein
MPLISSVSIAGRNQTTVVDVFRADSAMATLTAAAGGIIDSDADFRTQTLPVIADTTNVVPVDEGEDKTISDATVTTPKYNVKMWPLFRAITEQYEANKDPAALAAETVGAMTPRFPIGLDKYYMDLIIAGASVTEVVYDPTAGVASIKSLLSNFTSTSFAADGFALTRRGVNELGFNVDGQKLRNDLTQATGLNTAVTGAVLANKGSNTVLGLVGPHGQSAISIAAGMSVVRLAEAEIDGKGPRNGYVNYRGQMAMGWGNAQATNQDLTIDGAGWVVLTLAP